MGFMIVDTSKIYSVIADFIFDVIFEVANFSVALDVGRFFSITCNMSSTYFARIF